MTAPDAAQRKLSTAPPEFRFAVLFAPRAQRAPLTALFTVYLEIREILRKCSDAEVARTKLGWWQEELKLLGEHQPRHPLVTLLDQKTRQTPLPMERWLEIIQSVASDISGTPFQNYDDVEKYCKQRGGALAELTAVLAGHCTSGTLNAARLLGQSWQLADIVLHGLGYAAHGRIYFAADDLRKHGVDRHVSGETHSTAGVQALLRDYTGRARSLHATALAQTEAARPALRTGLVLSGLAQARLQKFARRAYRETAAPVELPPFTQLWTAWHCARRTR